MQSTNAILAASVLSHLTTPTVFTVQSPLRLSVDMTWSAAGHCLCCRKLALIFSACVCMARAWQKYATDRASCRGMAAARRISSVARTIMMIIHQASLALPASTPNTQTKLVKLAMSSGASSPTALQSSSVPLASNLLTPAGHPALKKRPRALPPQSCPKGVLPCTLHFTILAGP